MRKWKSVVINEAYIFLITYRTTRIYAFNDNGARAFSVMAHQNYNINLSRSEGQVKYRLNIWALLNYRWFFIPLWMAIFHRTLGIRVKLLNIAIRSLLWLFDV